LKEEITYLDRQQENLLAKIKQCPACGSDVGPYAREQLIRFFAGRA